MPADLSNFLFKCRKKYVLTFNYLLQSDTWIHNTVESHWIICTSFVRHAETLTETLHNHVHVDRQHQGTIHNWSLHQQWRKKRFGCISWPLYSLLNWMLSLSQIPFCEYSTCVLTIYMCLIWCNQIHETHPLGTGQQLGSPKDCALHGRTA